MADYEPINPEQVEDINELVGTLNTLLKEMFSRLDLRPNDQGKAGNMDAEVVESIVTSTSGFTVYHKLDRIPVGYLVIDASAVVNVYTTTLSETHLNLVADQDDVTIKLLVF